MQVGIDGKPELPHGYMSSSPPSGPNAPSSVAEKLPFYVTLVLSIALCCQLIVNMQLKRTLFSLLLSSIAVEAAIDDSAHVKAALAASRKKPAPVEEEPIIAKRQTDSSPFLNSNTTSTLSPTTLHCPFTKNNPLLTLFRICCQRLSNSRRAIRHRRIVCRPASDRR